MCVCVCANVYYKVSDKARNLLTKKSNQTNSLLVAFILIVLKAAYVSITDYNISHQCVRNVVCYMLVDLCVFGLVLLN